MSYVEVAWARESTPHIERHHIVRPERAYVYCRARSLVGIVRTRSDPSQRWRLFKARRLADAEEKRWAEIETARRAAVRASRAADRRFEVVAPSFAVKLLYYEVLYHPDARRPRIPKGWNIDPQMVELFDKGRAARGRLWNACLDAGIPRLDAEIIASW